MVKNLTEMRNAARASQGGAHIAASFAAGRKLNYTVTGFIEMRDTEPAGLLFSLLVKGDFSIPVCTSLRTDARIIRLPGFSQPTGGNCTIEVELGPSA